MKQLTWWGSIVTLIVIFLSCGKEKPLPTGYSDIYGDKEGVIAADTLLLQSGTEEFYNRLINTGSGTNLLLGTFQNYHSVIYLKFENFPDSSQVHSAVLWLTKSPFDSTFLNTDQQLTADINLAEFDWNNELDPEQYIDQLPFQNQPFQTVPVTFDTLDQIEIELDTLLVTQWTDSTSSLTNYGIWIDSPDAEFINSFYSTENSEFSVKPQLQLDYTFTDSTGQVRDTTTVYATMDAFLLLNSEFQLLNIEKDLKLDTSCFYIGKGFAFRSFLKFDLNSLDTTAHLNRALMEIVINKANSIRNAAGASDCRIYRVEGDSWAKNDVNEYPATASYAATLTDSTLIFDVTPTIQGWIGNNYPNYGFLVRSINEEQTLARVAFYSSKTNPEFQPRLYLYYTLPPKQEF